MTEKNEALEYIKAYICKDVDLKLEEVSVDDIIEFLTWEDPIWIGEADKRRWITYYEAVVELEIADDVKYIYFISPEGNTECQDTEAHDWDLESISFAEPYQETITNYRPIKNEINNQETTT